MTDYYDEDDSYDELDFDIPDVDFEYEEQDEEDGCGSGGCKI